MSLFELFPHWRARERLLGDLGIFECSLFATSPYNFFRTHLRRIMRNNPEKQAVAALLLLVSLAAIIGVIFRGGGSRAHSAGINDFIFEEETLIPKNTSTVSGRFNTTQSHCSSLELNDQISTPPPLPGKKGIGITLYPENWRLHLDLIKMLNVSWNYSWDANRIAAQPNDIEFVPMIWGRYSVLAQLVNDIIPEFKAKRIHRFLTFNEPDNEKQSNVAVKRVIDDYWPVLENAKIPMSSPAATHPLGNWSREFCEYAEASCLRMDYTALHWYGDANVMTFKKNIIEAYELYGRRPILLTEFAVADWDSKTTEENKVRRRLLLGGSDYSSRPLLHSHCCHSLSLARSLAHSLLTKSGNE